MTDRASDGESISGYEVTLAGDPFPTMEITAFGSDRSAIAAATGNSRILAIVRRDDGLRIYTVVRRLITECSGHPHVLVWRSYEAGWETGILIDHGAIPGSLDIRFFVAVGNEELAVWVPRDRIRFADPRG